MISPASSSSNWLDEAKAILNQRGIDWRQALQAARDLTAYRNEPVRFVREILGQEPWEVQQHILTALAAQPRVSVRSCNGAGKTLCAAWAALWFLLSRPGSIVITTAPTGAQVKDLLWRRLRGAYAGAKVPLPGRCQTITLECGTEWYAKGMATDEEVRFQGPHSPHGVLMVGDEASGLAEWLFAAMEGTMTEEGAKMLLIGNPNQTGGTFYESQRAWPAAQRFHISAPDVPETIIRRSWIAEKRAEWGEESPLYQVRVLGNFPPQSEDALINLNWAEAAQQRDLPAGQPVRIGVDVAYKGADESVATVRAGSKVLAVRNWRGNDTQESAGRVLALVREFGPQGVNVDVIGYGAGVYDAVKRETRATGIHVGEKAHNPEQFYDRRSELYWGLRERFQQGDIDLPPDCQILVDQLTLLRFSYTARGQIRLESKDDMRKRRPSGARWQSPDWADSLMLAFAGSGPRWVPRSRAGAAIPVERTWA